MQLHTYLNYGGNCRMAFEFYERHLGGKILALMTRAEQPGGGDVPPSTRRPEPCRHGGHTLKKLMFKM